MRYKCAQGHAADHVLLDALLVLFHRVAVAKLSPAYLEEAKRNYHM